MKIRKGRLTFWMLALFSERVGNRCKDLRWCVRLDSPTCCVDRLMAERSIEHLHQERRLWSV